jgi:hypothetical protein
MYRQIFNQISHALGTQTTKFLLLTLPGMLFFALLVLSRQRARERAGAAELKAASGWRGLLRSTVLNSMRLNLGIFGIGLLCVMLSFQSGLFTQRTGRVSQRSYEAVKSKWGSPHEQAELQVHQYVWELQTEEEFAGGGKREVSEALPEVDSAEEAVLSDETFDPKLDKNGKIINMHEVVRRVKKRVRKDVPQDPIISGSADITIRSSPRWLGGTGYAGYEDDCSFEFLVTNRSKTVTRANFSFPLPGEHGIFNHLQVKENDKDLGGAVTLSGQSLEWKRTLTPDEQVKVQVHYESRGLEYFRYLPGSLREHYTVQMRVLGIPHERLNFPIGAMSPADDLAGLSGEDYTLHWDLSHAVTSFSMGVIVPSPRAPGVDVSRILVGAPPGLILLILLLVVTRILIGTEIEMLPLALTALLHYLAYIAFANFSTVIVSFGWAYAAGITLPALGGAYLWLGREGWTFSGIQAAVLHLLFTLGYPVAIYFEDYTGVILYTAYTLLALYVIVQAVGMKRRTEKITAGVLQVAPGT